jgi:hypothetical protein
MNPRGPWIHQDRDFICRDEFLTKHLVRETEFDMKAIMEAEATASASE